MPDWTATLEYAMIEATEKPPTSFLNQPHILANLRNIALELKTTMESCSSTPNYKTKLLSDF